MLGRLLYMPTESRTYKSIRNSSVALVMYFINLLLQFYSRRIFLDYLGTDILGLNTTATNILQFLNLAELGVWTAIATSLYKPLNEDNREEIKRIITFNGQIYKRIACCIILASGITMLFFPLIFEKSVLPLWYAYASFGVLLFSSLLGYFVNYKQLVLSADQQDYKIQYTYKLSMSLKVIAQILAMIFLSSPYVWWLIFEVVFAILGSVSLNIAIVKTYPYLESTKDSFYELKHRYPELIVKIKQLFIQKISGFVLFQSSPLVIYGLADLTLVTLYGNYLLIIQGLISLMAALFNSMLAGIGNLVASSDRNHVLEVFEQLFSFRFYIISILSVGVYLLGNKFVSLWIGNEYLLPESTLLLMTLNFFIYLNRYVIYDYLSAYGYFGDVWASIIEVILNIGLSIYLGIIWGLNGVILGVLVTNIIISLVWKPIYLFKIKLRVGYMRFCKLFIKLCVIIIVGYFVSIMLSNCYLPLKVPDKYYESITLGIFTLLSGALMFISFRSFRKLIKRFI